MDNWLKISLMLCVFGVLKEFRPSEPYVTKFLINDPMNFTLDEVSNDIYPVSIYTTMASLVVVFLITDYLRYKPVIIFDSICGVIVFIMLITVRSLFLIQVLEVFYGLFMACEVAYYTYIYAKVDKVHYQKVSGFTRAAYLVGRCISGVVSQIYIILNPSSYYSLNFFTLVGMILATLSSCLLPPVKSSIYFSRVETLENGTAINHQKPKSQFMKSLKYLSADFCSAFTNVYILKWMFWWSLATCGYYQVLSYVQILWEQILKESETKENDQWNGAIEAIYTLLSAGAAFATGMIRLNWKHYGEPALSVCSLIIAALLFIMSQTSNILVAYKTYVLYTIFYNGMITIANSEIATYLNPDSHGLIFGFTTFMALVFQSILTTSVSSLPERTKFVIYSYYFLALGTIFVITTLFKVIKHLTNKGSKDENEENA